jgi:hypothetical protein
MLLGPLAIAALRRHEQLPVPGPEGLAPVPKKYLPFYGEKFRLLM